MPNASDTGRSTDADAPVIAEDTEQRARMLGAVEALREGLLEGQTSHARPARLRFIPDPVQAANQEAPAT